MGNDFVSTFRSPTRQEYEAMIRFLEKEYRHYSIPLVVWCIFLGVVGGANILSVFVDRNPFEKYVSMVIGILFLVFCVTLLKQRSLRKTQLISIRENDFEVLECRIEKVLTYNGGTGSVCVYDTAGTGRWDWLQLDGVTIKRFQRGEDPVVLLMRHSGGQFVLFSEHRLNS